LLLVRQALLFPQQMVVQVGTPNLEQPQLLQKAVLAVA
jgi:hypothetical protein